MVDPEHGPLSITRQCRLVSIARSSFYYEGHGESPLNLRLMRLIDEQFLISLDRLDPQVVAVLGAEGLVVAADLQQALASDHRAGAVSRVPGRGV